MPAFLLRPTLAAATLIVTAHAHAAPQAFDLPAQGLGQSLREVSQQAAISLAFDERLVAGHRAPALHGHYEPAVALNLLVAGSGLQLQQGAIWSITAAPASAALELGVTQVNGQQLGETTEGSGSYTTGLATAATKLPISLKETPQSVSVVTRQQIEDQQLTTLGKALRQATGLTESQGSLASANYYSRGFAITNYRLDGGTSVSDSIWRDMDTSIYDHIEILRGADGLFAGSGEPGGTINLVRKRPTFEPQLVTESSAGRWDNYRQMLDVSGPLAFDGKLRGRAVMVQQDAKSFIDRANSDHSLFYGVLEADLSESTNLFAGLSYDYANVSEQTYGLPRAANGADLKLPRSTYLSGKHDLNDQDTRARFFTLTQQLGDHWTFKLDGLHTDYDIRRAFYTFAGAVDPDTGSGVSGVWSQQRQPNSERSLDANVQGRFEAFGLEHSLVAGWMWHKARTLTYLESTRERFDIPNIFAFNPSAYPSHAQETVPSYGLDYDVRKQGSYASLRLQLAEPLHLITGVSLTDYDYDFVFTTASSGNASPTRYADHDVLVPFVGLTYDLTPQWTAYTSASEIYVSQASNLKGPPGEDGGGSPLDPVTGKSYELGVKGELFEGRVNTSLALYYIKRNGEAVLDERYPDSNVQSTGATCCYLPKGQVVSKGLDFEISGEVLPRLQATFGYTFNQNQNRTEGAAYSSITPKHLAKLFASYRLSGALERLRLGGGVSAQSATYVSGETETRTTSGALTSAYDFVQPGYATWNAFASYDLDSHWSLAANLDNLFDKTYYSSVGYSDYGNFYGEPRSYTVSLRGTF